MRKTSIFGKNPKPIEEEISKPVFKTFSIFPLKIVDFKDLARSLCFFKEQEIIILINLS
ncbi:hypothetical protein JG677_07585 [Campylobacter sp. TTU-622]|uniref:hypothetical protein n=1 Tax=Campylobacter sp. TTU-622 TaxID=2800583 RepID=UPI001908C285|nr:hypothetical protein [Campylobacter sp. TTU-622]MBK1973903.1 hypothetical protein [Campylobacter sp. TTU-622]